MTGFFCCPVGIARRQIECSLCKERKERKAATPPALTPQVQAVRDAQGETSEMAWTEQRNFHSKAMSEAREKVMEEARFLNPGRGLGDLQDAVLAYGRATRAHGEWSVRSATPSAPTSAGDGERAKDALKALDYIEETARIMSSIPPAMFDSIRTALATKPPLYRDTLDIMSTLREPAKLTDVQIEKLWHATFSTSNPFCPVDLKSFKKTVRAVEAAMRTTPGSTSHE